MQPLNSQNFDRLAKALMQRHGVTYDRALEMLCEIQLFLICGAEIRESPALQAAFLTAINTGKRAFRGGVGVCLPPDVKLLLPWPGTPTLNEVAVLLGARHEESEGPYVSSLIFGTVNRCSEGLRVICDGWRGGLVPAGSQPSFEGGADFALGGVFAGAFAVARSFLSAAGISHREVNEPIGYSLWRPDVCWLDPEAAGPDLQTLPSKLWLLGLGHLGQAYAWTLGLLPFLKEAPARIYLQDFDRVEDANWSAGLFCEIEHVGKLKTRLSAEWLEERHFITRLVERRFDSDFKRTANEPRIALCGFDNPESRRVLEEVGFELIVDAGLGASLDHFDRIVLRTFPEASQKPHEIWTQPAAELPGLDLALFGQPKEECGIVLQELAGKAISSSFTGACASALVLAEVLRALHGGNRCEFVAIQLRDFDLPINPFRDEIYQLRVARNGSVPVDPRFIRNQLARI